MNKKIALKTENLTKIYKMGEFWIRAVDNINLEVKKGDFVSIMGISGSGKTTLLNLLGCIDKPTSGRIYLEGEEINSLSEKSLDKIRLRKIGFIFQTFNLFPQLSAWENIELPMELAGVSMRERKERTEELLKMVGLEKRANHKPYQLSTGEQQRVGIARALANSPSLILADEPTGNLDTRTSKDIVQLLRELNQKTECTLMVVTHNQVVAEAAEIKIRMQDGRLHREEEN